MVRNGDGRVVVHGANFELLHLQQIWRLRLLQPARTHEA
jgi:hypothetical protein